MVRRLFLAVAVLVIVCGRQAVKAEPITYKFSGTFDVPNDSFSPDFNGSFTIGSEKLLSTPAYPDISYTQIPLTMSFAGETFGPLADVTLHQDQGTGGKPWTEVVIQPTGAGQPANDFHFGFLLRFMSPGTLSQFTDLSQFNFSRENLASISDGFMGNEGMYVYPNGTLESYQAVPAPEPSTLLVFMALVGAAWAHHRHRRTREVMTE